MLKQISLYDSEIPLLGIYVEEWRACVQGEFSDERHARCTSTDSSYTKETRFSHPFSIGNDTTTKMSTKRGRHEQGTHKTIRNTSRMERLTPINNNLDGNGLNFSNYEIQTS